MFIFKQKCRIFASTAAIAATMMGCNKPLSFSRTPDSILFGRPIEKLLGSSSSTLSKTSETFKQDQYDKNNTTVQFRVTQGKTNVSGVKKDDIVLTEFGIDINSFQMQTSTENIGRIADIVFVIDDTSSMQKYIDAVKAKVTGFVQNLASTNIKANLCLVTFGDEVHTTCTSFVEDNPATAANENLDNFLSQLSTIKTNGGADIPENQLAALMAAADRTPWHADAQKIAVLVTDADFHYAPDSLGNAPTAPTYQAAYTSVLNSGMMTFAVAPDVPGYSQPFNGLDAIPAASLGNWYNLAEIIDGTKDLDDIFNSILNQISIVYMAKYTVEDYAGLDPSLPLTDRSIAVKAKNSNKPWTVRMISASSNLPTGRPQYKQSFTIQTTDYRMDSLNVSVDGRSFPIASLSGKTVNLASMPSPGATVKIEYYKTHLRDNLSNVLPITFDVPKEGIEVEVIANGFELVEGEDYTLTPVDADTFTLTLRSKLLDDSDPLRIAFFGRLDVGIFEK